MRHEAHLWQVFWRNACLSWFGSVRSNFESEILLACIVQAQLLILGGCN